MRTIGLVFLALSLPAFACPDLSGQFPRCDSLRGTTNQVKDLVMTQTDTNFEMSYVTVETEQPVTLNFKADGVPYTVTQRIPDPAGVMETTTTTTCLNDKLNVAVQVKLNGGLMLNSTTEFQLVNGLLIQEMSGQLFGQNISDTIVCQ